MRLFLREKFDAYISLRSCVFFQVSDGSKNEFDDIDCAIVSREGRSLDADGEVGIGGRDQEEADGCHDPEAEIREGCQPGSEPLEFSYRLGEGLRLLYDDRIGGGRRPLGSGR